LVEISFTMIIQVINFAILLWLLNKFLFSKILDYLDRRAQGIEMDMADASRLQQEATDLKVLQETELLNAKKEAAEIVRMAHKRAESDAHIIIANAEKENNAIIVNGKKSLEIELEKAKAELQNNLADVAMDIAQKILEREIKPQDQQKIINDALKKIEKWN